MDSRSVVLVVAVAVHVAFSVLTIVFVCQGVVSAGPFPAAAVPLFVWCVVEVVPRVVLAVVIVVVVDAVHVVSMPVVVVFVVVEATPNPIVVVVVALAAVPSPHELMSSTSTEVWRAVSHVLGCQGERSGCSSPGIYV